MAWEKLSFKPRLILKPVLTKVEYYSAIKNEIIPFAATCMDVIIILTFRILKRGYKWTYLENRNRLTENKFIVTKGEWYGKDRLGVWDWQIYITIYKTDNW